MVLTEKKIVRKKNILGAPFFSKSAPQSLAPPPTFWSFLRPWFSILL